MNNSALARYTLFSFMFLGLYSCGGGGGGGGLPDSTGPTALQPDVNITLPDVGGQLPPGVIEYGLVRDGVADIYKAKGVEGLDLLLVGETSTPGQVFDLSYKQYLDGKWDSDIVVKEGMSVSDIHFVKDGDNDVHIAWYTPGEGISARSRVSGSWYGESLLTNKGACLNLTANLSSGGALATWCEEGGFIGHGSFGSVAWINRGVFKNVDGSLIEGTNPDSEILSDGQYVVSWSGIDLGSDGVTPKSSVNVAQFLASGQVQISDKIQHLEVSAAPISDIHADEVIKAVTFSSIHSSDIDLNVSVYDSGWKVSEVLEASPDGYTETRIATSSNGEMFLFAQTMGRKLSIYQFGGTDWSLALEKNDIFDWDYVFVGETLFVFYTESDGSKIAIFNGGSLNDVIRIPRPVYDVGIGRIGDKVIAVWRDENKALYLVGKF